MKKAKRVIKICIITVVILMIICRIIAFAGGKIVPKGDISVRKYDGFYHSEVSREEYFLDENGRIIKKIEADEEGISLITEKEYDSLGRLTGEKFRNNAFVFFADDKGTKSYRYYKDTDMITDYVKSEKWNGTNAEKGLKEHKEYDTEGKLVYEEQTDYIEDIYTESIITKYNPNGIILYQEETNIKEDAWPSEMTNDGKPMVTTEYDPDNKIIRKYYCGKSYGSGRVDEFYIYSNLRNLVCEIKLTDDGKYDTIKSFYIYEDEDEDCNVKSGLIDVTYYDYSPNDTEAEYITTKYNSNGIIESMELFDEYDRCFLSIRYSSDGEEAYRTETDYNAEDPDLPGEQVIESKNYIRDCDADGNVYWRLNAEKWMKKVSMKKEMNEYYGMAIDTNELYDGIELYRSYVYADDVKKPLLECSFQNNGFIKEKHSYSYYYAYKGSYGYLDSEKDYDELENIDEIMKWYDLFKKCDETIYEYDEHGNILKQWYVVDYDEEKVLQSEWEYTYRS